MIDSGAQLVVDERLFLQAMTTLAELEDRAERFELLNVIDAFTSARYVGSHFHDEVGREMDADDAQAIEYYVSAVYLVRHHRASIDRIDEVLMELEPAARQVVRAAAWAFLQAWTMRYGGFDAQRVVSNTGTLIDPR